MTRRNFDPMEKHMKMNRLNAALLVSIMMSAAATAQSPQQQAEVDAQRASVEAQRAELQAQAAARQGDRDRARALEAGAAAAADQARAAGRSATGRGRENLSERDALAIAALEGLMSAPDDRALPILQKVLKGTHSDLVKSRALFVLSQIGLDEAQLTLLDFVRTAKGELRGEAIRSVGIGGNEKSLEALLPILQGGDGSLRPQIMEAFLIAGRKDLMLQVARSAKNEEDAEQAIHMLSAMGAIEELRQLGADGKYAGSLIQAYAVAGDLQSLRRIAESSAPVAQREDAIRSIGIVSSKDARLALREIYARTSEPKLKDAALQGMMIIGDEEGVLALYRAAKDTDEKRRLLRTLSTMGGDAALEAIDAALQGNSP
jgi:HEAT repeat protein